MANKIRVIGAEWCHDTQRTKKQLNALKIREERKS